MRNINDWQTKKNQHEKISMVTCYDASFAKIIAQSEIDAVLVGDSCAQVVYGHEHTIHAELDLIAACCRSVKRILRMRFVIGDLPFLSYRKSLSETMNAVEKLMKTGIDAVKLEGQIGNQATIEHCVNSGVPVMGHLGLTPQAIQQLGGYRVQGKSQEAANTIAQQAKALQEAGCFALVLECIPAKTAAQISQNLTIPTIGIGAGKQVDGQILVLHDLLGLSENFNPKFLKKFCDGYAIFQKALTEYHQAVLKQDFPAQEHEY